MEMAIGQEGWEDLIAEITQLQQAKLGLNNVSDDLGIDSDGSQCQITHSKVKNVLH